MYHKIKKMPLGIQTIKIKYLKKERANTFYTRWGAGQVTGLAVFNNCTF